MTNLRTPAQPFQFLTLSQYLILALFLSVLAACSMPEEGDQTVLSEAEQGVADGPLVPFDSFTLENGLKVILHRDTSDPVVAVALTAHVGSAREKEGRTGFAHLFEHLLFLESENLGKGGLDKMSARIGGSGANGSTSRDRTNYFQTVPKDALEKMIWAEADKLGYFINTVTEPVLAKEKQVVKNEKRQSVDNRPYGHGQYITDKALYPEGHPYSWQVIGSLDDLQAATLDDVKEFFRRWYVPNNVMLVIAGDFDAAQAKAWVHKYFDEIPRGEEVARQVKQPAGFTETKNLYHEDNFARQAQLTLTWPTVPQYGDDSYALNVLADLLTVGKDAPMNAVLVNDAKITSNVLMGSYASELAGQMLLRVTAYSDVDLDDVKMKIDEAFARFEADGISDADLARVKTQQEVQFFGNITSVLGKAFSLAQYEIFAGDAGFIEEDIEKIRAVTADDVMRVYKTYIKDRPYVAVSMVPKGMTALALEGGERAEVVEEKIVTDAEDSVDPNVVAEYERTPSSFDRSVEPPYGAAPTVTTPAIWQAVGSNGLKVYGIKDSELPLVQFDLTVEGGQLLDSFDKVGTANLVAELMDKGTKNRTTAELEKEIASLGAVIDINAGPESIEISGSTLARNFAPTMELLREMLLEPRFDAEEFGLAKLRAENTLEAQAGQPSAIAARLFAEVVYGKDHIFSKHILGTRESLPNITLDDVKAFYDANLSPSISNFHVVGDVGEADVMKAIAGLTEEWQPRDVTLPDYPLPVLPEQSKIYFYDIPDAKQSQFRFGYPALNGFHEEFYPATAMNYRLGGGSFASQLTQELREGKGYTYGIRSGFVGGLHTGYFQIATGVRSNVTAESFQLIHDIMSRYSQSFTDADLDVTKGYFEKSRARAFETLSDKAEILKNISHLGLPVDYVSQQDAAVQALSLDDVKNMARRHIRPQAMHYVIVGDAKTQLERVKAVAKTLDIADVVQVNP